MKPKQHSLCNSSSAGIFLSNMLKHNIFLLVTLSTKKKKTSLISVLLCFSSQYILHILLNAVSSHFLSNLNNFLL